ncbi:ATP-binding protein [Waterburya agarophytonicola K14]|uniref:ATP-binding protein n=1 Tax=Waterburya agarophytonicola KI4 TaxID=2874699 RepID=A0A964FDE6_9CYAN|nr:ATP-binding protein [Waterburya agarophytonicola KI4]
MKVLQTIYIEVLGDLRELDKLLLEFNRIYRDFIPCRDWLECRLALAEGFTNAVRHAHKNIPPEITIEIEVLLRRNYLEIRIWDYGSAFNLQEFIVKTARKHNSWLSSGRGIPLLNKIADRLDYQRTKQNRNCLLIIKRFSDHRSKNTTTEQKNICMDI